MTYDPEDRGSVAVDEGGNRTGLIVAAVIVLVVLALIGSFLLSGLQLGASGGNGGGPAPSLSVPGSGAS